MALYLISYDLHKVRKYVDLYKVLDTWKAKRLLESLWLAELKGPTADIMKILRIHVDADDNQAKDFHFMTPSRTFRKALFLADESLIHFYDFTQTTHGG